MCQQIIYIFHSWEKGPADLYSGETVKQLT